MDKRPYANLQHENMVRNQIAPFDVQMQTLLEAYGVIPRDFFVPKHLKPIAYSDAFLEEEGQYLLFPAAYSARLLQALNPQPEENALVIGDKTGYMAAILGYLGLEVTYAEENPTYRQTAVEAFKKLDLPSITPLPLTLNPLKLPQNSYDIIFVQGLLDKNLEIFKRHLTLYGRIGAFRSLDTSVITAYIWSMSQESKNSKRDIFEISLYNQKMLSV